MSIVTSDKPDRSHTPNSSESALMISKLNPIVYFIYELADSKNIENI